MQRHVIVGEENGYDVYVDMLNSDAGKFLSYQPYVVGLIKEVLQGAAALTSPQVMIEKDMGRVIGVTDIVSTSEADAIYYARPIKRTIYRRYARNRLPTPSSTLTVHLKKDEQNDYELINVWIGPNSPPFPGDDSENDKSREYWESHALAHNANPVQSKTVTKDCPY